MINPKEVIPIVPKSSYMVPLFVVGDHGLEHAEDFRIDFCKGDKSDPKVNRQVGFFTETLIAVAKRYLEDNNVEGLASRETSIAISKLTDALIYLQMRSEDRKRRGVQGTHQS